MTIALNPAKRIVDRFGGVAKMAKIMDLSPNTIQGWIGVGHIHWKYWQTIIDIGAENGIEVTPFDFVVHLQAKPLRHAA